MRCIYTNCRLQIAIIFARTAIILDVHFFHGIFTHDTVFNHAIRSNLVNAMAKLDWGFHRLNWLIETQQA